MNTWILRLILSPCSVIIRDQKKLNRCLKDALMWCFFFLKKIIYAKDRASETEFIGFWILANLGNSNTSHTMQSYCCIFFFLSIITYFYQSLNHLPDFVLFSYVCTEFRLIYINDIQKITQVFLLLFKVLDMYYLCNFLYFTQCKRNTGSSDHGTS